MAQYFVRERTRTLATQASPKIQTGLNSWDYIFAGTKSRFEAKWPVHTMGLVAETILVGGTSSLVYGDLNTKK